MPKIQLSDTQLFFDVYGSKLQIDGTSIKEKPTLIVLHGGHGFVDHTLYIEFWSQFLDIAQVIFLDQRGCGRSDLCDHTEWNLKHWAEDLYQFCNALSIKKPIIAGISMGGHVMCEYIKNHASQPGALIFCNTEARFDLDTVCDAFRNLAGNEVADIAYENYTNPTPEIIKRYKQKCVPFYAKNAYTPEEISRCVQRPEVFEHYCKYEATHFNYLKDMHKIHCPTLFMVGKESPLHPPKAAKEMADEIDSKWVTYHEFKNAGAAVYKDSPEEAYQVVKNFINEIKTTAKS